MPVVPPAPLPIEAYVDADTRSAKPSFTILGLNQTGQTFRPSDWAERLCGIMAQFQPPGMQASRIGYSPYVMPSEKEGVKSVMVDGAISLVEPLAYKFLLNFVRDNQLKTIPPLDTR
jgi:Protein of unknown function (DUF3579)